MCKNDLCLGPVVSLSRYAYTPTPGLEMTYGKNHFMSSLAGPYCHKYACYNMVAVLWKVTRPYRQKLPRLPVDGADRSRKSMHARV